MSEKEGTTDALEIAREHLAMVCGKDVEEMSTNQARAQGEVAEAAALIDIAESLRKIADKGTGAGPWNCLCGREFGPEAWLNQHYEDATGKGHEGPRPGSDA